MLVQEKRLAFVLYNLRSVANVGSLFRTADSCGIREIFLIGVTPTPVDRFGRLRADMHKVALGAESTVPWHFFATWEEAQTALRMGGYQIVAVEQDPRAQDYTRLDPGVDAYAYVLGNEVEGLPKVVLDSADTHVELIQEGSKESLNVAVAGAVVAYDMRRKWRDLEKPQVSTESAKKH